MPADAPRLALVPSPFTGPAAWRPVADLLPQAVAVDYGGVDGGYAAAARRIAAVMGEGPWIAVVHSGAGGLVPDLADVAAGLAGLIFVDAVRPHPGRSLRDVEPAFVAQLAGRAEAGRLPPWNLWFDEDPLPRLLPDPSARTALLADLPRTPLAFLEAIPTASSTWERLPAAYLQLSGRYAAQADWAEAHGWSVARARLHHLAMASHPAEMAARIAALAEKVDSRT